MMMMLRERFKEVSVLRGRFWPLGLIPSIGGAAFQTVLHHRWSIYIKLHDTMILWHHDSVMAWHHDTMVHDIMIPSIGGAPNQLYILEPRCHDMVTPFDTITQPIFHRKGALHSERCCTFAFWKMYEHKAFTLLLLWHIMGDIYKVCPLPGPESGMFLHS